MTSAENQATIAVCAATYEKLCEIGLISKEICEKATKIITERLQT